MGSILGPIRVISKSCTYCCYNRCATLIVWVGEMSWHKTGATHYHAQLELPDKGRAIKGLVVWNSWYLEPWDLLNGLALGCYHPFPEVWLICKYIYVFSEYGKYRPNEHTSPLAYHGLNTRFTNKVYSYIVAKLLDNLKCSMFRKILFLC